MWAASPAGGTCEYCKQFASGEHGATSPAGDVCVNIVNFARVANMGQHHQSPASGGCEHNKYCAYD